MFGLSQFDQVDFVGFQRQEELEVVLGLLELWNLQVTLSLILMPFVFSLGSRL
jgi:hypothetical protein